MTRGAIALAVLLGVARSVSAQQPAPAAPCAPTPGQAKPPLTFRPFAEREWYSPIVAEPRGAQSELMVWSRSKAFPYMPDAALTVWDLSFGKELPVAAWDKRASNESLFECRGWGFGFWVPGSFHMLIDAGDDSSPILNHDYKLAAAFKAARAVSSRDLISIKVQFGHESTHLGDEFVLHALQTYGDAFQRINVSYEYLEAGVNWERYLGAARAYSLSLRASGTHSLALGTDAGWYGTQLIDGTHIQPSRLNFEPAFGAEYLPHGTGGWRPFVSYDGRLRTIYDYQKSSADAKEDRQFSSSLVVGLRNLNWMNRGMPDLIFKGYYGVNPNGQFRSQSHYWMFGFGLLIRL